MSELPSQIAGVVALLTALTGVIYALVKLIPRFSKEERDIRKSVAGITFEERLATLEFGQMKLETNHLAHIQADIESLTRDIARISSDLTSVRERVARLEGR